MTWSTDPPTQPGFYWMQRHSPYREIIVEVIEIEGVMMIRWPDDNQPVAQVTAKWSGLITPS